MSKTVRVFMYVRYVCMSVLWSWKTDLNHRKCSHGNRGKIPKNILQLINIKRNYIFAVNVEG